MRIGLVLRIFIGPGSHLRRDLDQTFDLRHRSNFPHCPIGGCDSPILAFECMQSIGSLHVTDLVGFAMILMLELSRDFGGSSNSTLI